MKIIQTYSHFNGLEFLLVHKPQLWDEIQQIVSDTDAHTKNSADTSKTTVTDFPIGSHWEIKQAIEQRLIAANWKDSRLFEPIQQEPEILVAGETSSFSGNDTDFVKERVAIEIHFGSDSFDACGLFAKPLAFYVGDKIDVGIEILPMKSLQTHMSSGPSYYEGELYNVVRQGRGVPAVPLVIVGVEP